jgi:hypothetical protein
MEVTFKNGGGIPSQTSLPRTKYYWIRTAVTSLQTFGKSQRSCFGGTASHSFTCVTLFRRLRFIVLSRCSPWETNHKNSWHFGRSAETRRGYFLNTSLERYYYNTLTGTELGFKPLFAIRFWGLPEFQSEYWRIFAPGKGGRSFRLINVSSVHCPINLRLTIDVTFLLSQIKLL